MGDDAASVGDGETALRALRNRRAPGLVEDALAALALGYTRGRWRWTAALGAAGAALAVAGGSHNKLLGDALVVCASAWLGPWCAERLRGLHLNRARLLGGLVVVLGCPLLAGLTLGDRAEPWAMSYWIVASGVLVYGLAAELVRTGGVRNKRSGVAALLVMYLGVVLVLAGSPHAAGLSSAPYLLLWIVALSLTRSRLAWVLGVAAAVCSRTRTSTPTTSSRSSRTPCSAYC